MSKRIPAPLNVFLAMYLMLSKEVKRVYSEEKIYDLFD